MVNPIKLPLFGKEIKSKLEPLQINYNWHFQYFMHKCLDLRKENLKDLSIIGQ